MRWAACNAPPTALEIDPQGALRFFTEVRFSFAARYECNLCS